MNVNVTGNHARNAKRDTVFAIITVIISTVFCLVAAEYGLRLYQRSIDNSSVGDPGLLRYHSQRGWTLTPSWQGRHKHHDFDVRYTINKYGYRGRFPENFPQKSKRRVAIIGDSFSFGLGVNDEDSFTAQLNQRQATIDFLNLSVPGYSTDQQLLLLKASHPLVNADEYILIIYLGNDLLDNMLSYPLQVEQAKPVFGLAQDKSLVLNNVPVPRIAKPAALRSLTLNSVIFGDSLKKYQSRSLFKNTQIMNRLMPAKASADKVTVFNILDQRLAQHKLLMQALVKDMRDYTEKHNVGFRIALLAGRSFILAPESYSAYFQEYIGLFIKDLSGQLTIPFIDIAGRMRDMNSKKSPGWFHPNEGHLTREGHQLVSEVLVKALELQ